MKRVTVGIRYALGIVFIIYGMTKFFRLQNFDLQVSGDINNVSSSDLFWYFFGYSNVYLYFLGIIEFGSGLLILSKRFHRVGTLSCLALAANVTLLDFVYNIGPVRFWALFLTVSSALLIFLDRKPYQSALNSLFSE